MSNDQIKILLFMCACFFICYLVAYFMVYRNPEHWDDCEDEDLEDEE